MLRKFLSAFASRYGERLLNAAVTGRVIEAGYGIYERSLALRPSTPRIIVFRGVPRDHPRYLLASKGIVVPRNPFGSQDIDAHNFGSAKTAFTSWTRNRDTGVTYAEPHGVLLEASLPGHKVKWSPDIWYENEVLINGIVAGAKVTKVIKQTTSTSSPQAPPL